MRSIAASFIALTLLLPIVAFADLTTSIVSYYKLDGNSTDSAGGYNGSDTAITYGSSYGKINQGASFNGSTSKIIVGTNFGITYPFSVSAWIYPTNSGAGPFSIAASRSDGTLSYSGWMLDYSNSKAELDLRTNGGTQVVYTYTTSNLTLNAWNFVTATVDASGNVTIYLNGVGQLLGTWTNGTIAQTSQNGSIGASQNGSAFFYVGDIDEVGFWSRVLSFSEVSQLWNSGSGLQYPFTSTSVARVRPYGAFWW